MASQTDCDAPLRRGPVDRALLFSAVASPVRQDLRTLPALPLWNHPIFHLIRAVVSRLCDLRQGVRLKRRCAAGSATVENGMGRVEGKRYGRLPGWDKAMVWVELYRRNGAHEEALCSQSVCRLWKSISSLVTQLGRCLTQMLAVLDSPRCKCRALC